VPNIAPPGSVDVYPNLIIANLGGLELGRYSSLDKFVKGAVPDNLALRGVGDGSFAGNQRVSSGLPKTIGGFTQD
jgi:hypothetical protein